MSDPSHWEQDPAASSHYGPTRTQGPYVIVMHATAGTNSLGWLTGSSSPPVSAHFLIDKDGTVHRLVRDNQIAWHAGVSRWARFGGPGQASVNSISIGIELENLSTGIDPYPMLQVRAAAEVCYELYRAHGVLPIVSHESIAPGRKTDPAGFPWGEFHTHLSYLITHNQ